jgi:hypothetical protein
MQKNWVLSQLKSGPGTSVSLRERVLRSVHLERRFLK